MELIACGTRFAVAREVGRAVFARHLALLQEGRTEAVEVPVGEPGSGVLHLALGVQPIALLDPRSVPQHDGDGTGSLRGLRVQEVFPDFDAFQPGASSGTSDGSS